MPQDRAGRFDQLYKASTTILAVTTDLRPKILPQDRAGRFDQLYKTGQADLISSIRQGRQI